MGVGSLTRGQAELSRGGGRGGVIHRPDINLIGPSARDGARSFPLGGSKGKGGAVRGDVEPKA